MTIVVGPEKASFEIPQKLLCYCSAYFEGALMGEFQEAKEGKVVIDEVSKEDFQLIAKWILTSHLEFSSATPISENLARIISFFELADRFQLLGPFDSVINETKTLLANSKADFKAGYINRAIVLPKPHPLRKLFAKYCASEYLQNLQETSNSPSFRFMTEIEENESFASDMLLALVRSTEARSLESRAKQNKRWEVPDPMDEKHLFYL